MKIAKIVGGLAVAYVATVVIFEAYLGIVQPQFGDQELGGWDATIVITTTDEAGNSEGRVVVPMDNNGSLYVSANHWPRSWYSRALKYPDVVVERNGETSDHTAVVVPSGSEEHDRLERDHPHPAWFRFMTGYPPRAFLRLEPR